MRCLIKLVLNLKTFDLIRSMYTKGDTIIIGHPIFIRKKYFMHFIAELHQFFYEKFIFEYLVSVKQ